jgi:hypothetical protein
VVSTLPGRVWEVRPTDSVNEGIGDRLGAPELFMESGFLGEPKVTADLARKLELVRPLGAKATSGEFVVYDVQEAGGLFADGEVFHITLRLPSPVEQIKAKCWTRP